MWPQTTLKTAVMKAAVETVSYTPAAMTCFYFFMSLLELKTLEEAAAEVRKKFLPTYKVCNKLKYQYYLKLIFFSFFFFLWKVGASIWPIVATINFYLIPERNRVPFISVCSLIWTCFLAYMKHLEHHQMDDESNYSLMKKFES